MNIGPNADSVLSTRITRMSFASWTDQQSDSVVRPDGQLMDKWSIRSDSHRSAAAKWSGETWFFEKGCAKLEPATSSDDPLDFSGREEPRGALAPVASRALMTIVYGARFVRWDLIKVVTTLAAIATKCATSRDAALFRLIRYIYIYICHSRVGASRLHRGPWGVAVFAIV